VDKAGQSAGSISSDYTTETGGKRNQKRNEKRNRFVALSSEPLLPAVRLQHLFRLVKVIRQFRVRNLLGRYPPFLYGNAKRLRSTALAKHCVRFNVLQYRFFSFC
jgi:hypothetical protein